MKNKAKSGQIDPMLYMLPPQNIEAEASLFSAILIDNGILDEILEILQPSDFYKSAHQIMFEAIVDLYQKKEPVDVISLANRLADKGQLESIGGGGLSGQTDG